MTARQAASFCKAGIDRVRILELIDSEIEAFNDLIATLAAGNGRGASSSNRNQDLLEAVEADRAIVRVLFLSFGLASPTKS